MAGTCLFRCVLIQVLLITVYGKSTMVIVNCPNQIATVGEPLHLMCTVTCKNCSPARYTWMKGNNIISCNNTSEPYRHNCTILSASEEHNGTFTVCVQTARGFNKTTMNVTIVARAAEPLTQTDVATVYTQEKTFRHADGAPSKERSLGVTVAVLVMFCFSISIMVAIFFKRNKNYQFRHNSYTV